MTEGLPQGLPTHYRLAGAGARPVVFIHGWGGDLTCWDEVVPLMSDGFRTVAVDLRGSGRSPMPASGYTFAHHEADLLALVDRLALGRFALVGHSRGGAFALHFALAHPRLLSGVVVVDSGATTAGNTFIEQFARRIRDQGITAAELTDAIRKWFYRISEERLAYFVDVALRTPPAVLAEALQGLLARDMRAELSGMQIPALIIYGEHDRNRSWAEAEFLRDAIPAADLRVFDGVAHCPHVESPRAFTRVLLEFLTEHARWT